MAKILANTKDMPREEWLGLRRQGIGGSDAATLLNLNPYDSLLGLWAEKKGLLAEKADTFPMALGRAFEGLVAGMWMEQTGRRVRQDHHLYQHEQAPWMLGNIDRRVIGENAGLECKTTGRFERMAFEDGTVERYYAAQCQWYMMVCGFERMYLAVLDRVSGRFAHYTVAPDIEQQQDLYDRAEWFWRECVLADCPPEPDGSEACGQVIRQLYPGRAELGLAALDGCAGDLAEYAALGKQKKAIEERQKLLAQQVQMVMGDCTKGAAGGYKVSWAPQVRRSVDAKALEADLPQVYRRYVRESQSRVFRVTAGKSA